MRVENDFYETPPWQTRALTSRQQIAGRVFEPCAGDGSIVNQLPQFITVNTNDIDPVRNAQYHLDAICPESWRQFQSRGAIDWVVTNPPFNSAMPILINAHRCARVGVAMLLRISFMEPTGDRSDWLAVNPPTRQFIMPRWSYKCNGKSDSVTTAWFIWLKNWTHIEIVPKSEKTIHANDPAR